MGFREIIVWDAASGKPLRKIGSEGAYKIALAPDGKTLAGEGMSKIIRLWDVATGREKRNFPGHTRNVHTLLFSSDGKTLISADEVDIRAHDVATGREVRRINAGGSRCVALSSDGTVLASGGSETANKLVEARLILWDMATRRKLRQLQANKHSVHAVAFSPDGQTLASAEVKIIHLWDVATGKEVRRIEKSGWSTSHLVFSPDGKTLASTAPGYETVIRLWDVATGKPLQPAGPDGVIHTVAFSPDGRFIATGSWRGHDPRVRLWDAFRGESLWACQGEVGLINRVMFTPDGKGVVASGTDKAVRLWDARTGKEVRKYPIPSDRAMAVSPDGKKLIAIGVRDNQMRVNGRDVRTGKRFLQRDGEYPNYVDFLVLSPDAEIVAEPQVQKLLRLSQVATGQLLLSLEPPNLETSIPGGKYSQQEAAAFSPDGRTVAVMVTTASRIESVYRPVCTIHLWELATGKRSLRISGGRNRLLALTFSPDGRTLASAGKGVLQLWDVATGKELLTHRGQEAQVEHEALAFSPDGTRLAAGYSDSTVLVWDLMPGIRRAGMPKKDFTGKDLDRLWSDLAADDAAKASAAVWSLVAAPKESLGLFKQRLKQLEKIDPQRIRRLLMDLDSSEFAVREAATKELEQIGEQADPLLREALKNKPSLEVRRRIEPLLVRPWIVTSPQTLRLIRAFQVLEQIGTPEAVRLLEAHARGAPATRATRDAKAALQRLARRAKVALP
jgi:WD40 repeat protein